MKYDILNNPKIKYVSDSKMKYLDLNGIECNEMILIFKLQDSYISDTISIFSNPYFLYASKDILKLRIPIINEELKKYFDNYKDYYYLPLEDMCILKSVGVSVDDNYKENAKKETCYIKYRGFFIPNVISNESGFKIDYKSKISYIEYSEEKSNPEYLTQYALALIEKLNN